jgi:transmembrane sensor
MPLSSRFHILVHRRLSREATPGEQRELQALLEQDPSLRARYAALEEIWLSARTTAPARGFDVEGAWGRLKAQLPSAEKLPSPPRRPLIFRYAWLATAAALVVGGTMVWRLRPEQSTPATTTQEIAWDTYESGPNRLTVVVLGDGTRVHLSQRSKLRYPKVALPDRREVFLEGEAYFEVATNPLRPFHVHAPGLVTQVLGTTFNVRAFPDETTRAVSLLSGSIDVTRVTGTATSETTRLIPGQQLRFDENDPGHEIRPIDAAKAIGWMRDRLEFQDEPLEAIARALTRKFDVEIAFDSPELRRISITADYQGQDLPAILELVRLTTGVQVDFLPKEGSRPAVITFRPRVARP